MNLGNQILNIRKEQQLTQEEFDAKIQDFTNNLNNLFAENKTLEDEIKKSLKELKYEKN